MAFFRESLSLVVAAAAMVALCTGGMVEQECPEEGYVYPYGSFCWEPAQSGTGYYFVAASSQLGGLVPEWDESNSTYYVRFTGDASSRGDLYAMSQPGRDDIATNVRTLIHNTRTKRLLGWRQEGEDDFFLVELLTDSDEEKVAEFQFTVAENVPLPCLKIANIRCEAYDLKSNKLGLRPKYGMLPIYEDGATYIKAGDLQTDAVEPFLLFRSSSISSHVPVIK